ncbi:MAG TPA: hypothetical protein VKB81_05690 [Nitrospira sp.]|nr:hypothetical protein [Nitrospira sp.]
MDVITSQSSGAAVVPNRPHSLAVWADVFRFYTQYPVQLLMILPLLFLPVLTDALHTLLVAQHRRNQQLNVGQAVIQAVDWSGPLLMVKAHLWLRGIPWAMLPVIGWVKNVKLRLAWGLCSNVLLLEGKVGTACRVRSEELSQSAEMGFLVRSLITMPAILLIISVVPYVFADAFVEGSWLFFVWLAFWFWVMLPASGAANTFAYLAVVSPSHSEGASRR